MAVLYRVSTFPGGELFGFDERLYVRYSAEVAKGGLAALRSSLARYPFDPTMRQGPLILRLGSIVPGAILARVFGPGPLPLAWLSCAAGLLCLALAGAIFRRFLPGYTALLATALCAVSPLATALGRLALQDGLFACWALAALLACERYLDERRARDLSLLGLACLLGILTKESMAIFYLLLVGRIAAGVGWRWREALAPLATLFVAGSLALALLAFAAGGPEALVTSYRSYLRLSDEIDYVRHFQQGPIFRYPVDLLLLSPAAFLFAILGLGASPMAPGLRRCAYWSLAGIGLYGALPNQNVRFILFADLLLRGAAAVGILELARRAPKRLRPLALALLAALALGAEHAQFERIFIRNGVYDPVTDTLVRADGLVR